MEDLWGTPKSSKGTYMPNHSTPKSSLDTAAAVQATPLDHGQTKTTTTPRAVQFASTMSPPTSRTFLGSWTAGNKKGPISLPEFKDRPRRSPSKSKNFLNEPSPEDLAIMMHRHQAGLNMSSAPNTMLKFLFPYQDDSEAFFQDSDLLRDLSDFGPGPWIDNSTFTTIDTRGTVNPPNFPGYLVALPDTDGKIAVAPSPGPVLSRAYEAFHMPTVSTVIIS